MDWLKLRSKTRTWLCVSVRRLLLSTLDVSDWACFSWDFSLTSQFVLSSSIWNQLQRSSISGRIWVKICGYDFYSVILSIPLVLLLVLTSMFPRSPNQLGTKLLGLFGDRLGFVWSGAWFSAGRSGTSDVDGQVQMLRVSGGVDGTASALQKYCHLKGYPLVKVLIVVPDLHLHSLTSWLD